nr:hypothetical protein [Candidatus Cloacimonadota bacterium]
ADSQSFPFPLLLSNFDTNNGLSSNTINDIQLNEDYLFLATESGCDYVNLDSIFVTSAWHNLNANNSSLPSDIATSISLQNSNLIIGTDNGILHIPNFPNLDTASVIDAGQSVFPVYIDSQENIWYSYGDWDFDVLILNDDQDTALTKIEPNGAVQTWEVDEAGLSTNKIMGFTEINGNLCLYSWGEGIFVLEANLITQIKKNSIMTNLVSDLQFDNDNKLWVANGYLGLEQTGKGAKGVCSFDGEVWQEFNQEKYPSLKNNNIIDIAVDEMNRKWFCCWQYLQPGTGGISVLNDSEEDWQLLSGYPSNYPSHLFLDDNGQMWVSAFGYNYVLDIYPEIAPQPSGSFLSAYDDDNLGLISFVDDEQSFFGSYNHGLEYWEDSSIPTTNGSAWEEAPSSELTSGSILDIKQRITDNGKETWIASTNGLFMFDGENWYLYGSYYKMSVWDNNEWFYSVSNPDPKYWYYEGQERLYGSNATYPTCLFIDPFNCLWIGTAEYGITVFDKEADTFSNITTENSSLISNQITAFEYDPHSGTLYIGTIDGISTVEIGISKEYNTQKKLNKVAAFPNPFHPENGETLYIENQDSFTMPAGDTTCLIYDLSGDLIVKLDKNIYEQFSWDGTNKAGKKCSSGMYYYIVSAPQGQVAKGKILLIR